MMKYLPLIIIVALISVASIVAGDFMRSFMAGFFLVFSGLKFFDLPGFAISYSRYDLLAKHFRPYAYIYPFLELSLGLSYLANFQPWWTNVFTVILMSFSAIGILNQLARGRNVECACMGTIIKVPLSKITLVEDLGMALMAMVSLIWL